MTAKTVAIGAAVVLVGVVVGMNVPTVEAQRGGAYSFLTVTAGAKIWRLRVGTGQVSFCAAKGTSAPPTCSPWGPVRR